MSVGVQVPCSFLLLFCVCRSLHSFDSSCSFCSCCHSSHTHHPTYQIFGVDYASQVFGVSECEMFVSWSEILVSLRECSVSRSETFCVSE